MQSPSISCNTRAEAARYAVLVERVTANGPYKAR
jgi:hypothetical protein